MNVMELVNVMAPILAIFVVYAGTQSGYTEVSHAEGITTSNVNITVPAYGSVVKSSTETVSGSSEGCPWRIYVQSLFDDAWTSTVSNPTSQQVTFSTPFRSGNSGNSWRLTASPFTNFARERTDWVYTKLRRDAN
jgi:hypothetical protein